MKKKKSITGIIKIIILIILIALAVFVVMKSSGYSVRVFPSKTAVCIDSDINAKYKTGLNYFKKGTCKDNKQKTAAIDECFDKNTVKEYHCSSSKTECLDILSFCAYGCVYGACRTKKFL